MKKLTPIKKINYVVFLALYTQDLPEKAVAEITRFWDSLTLLPGWTEHEIEGAGICMTFKHKKDYELCKEVMSNKRQLFLPLFDF